MAEAFLKRYAGDRFDVHSAGLEPRPIHSLTIQVMEEIGVSMDDHRPKPLSEFLGKVSVNYAIIVCADAEKTCPRIWPFTLRRLCWPFDDPAAFIGTEREQLERFREIRDEINERIQDWLADEAAE